MPRTSTSFSKVVRRRSTVFRSHTLLLLLLCPTVIHAVDIIDFAACAKIIKASFLENPDNVELRDKNNNPTSNWDEAWGISAETCTALCQGGAKVIEWNSFSLQVQSWLLPSLALTAQLPFETRSRAHNAQSLFMAVGSPFLITYSLFLTVLNARSIDRKFKGLLKENDNAIQREVIKAARVILRESQSVPLQAVNGSTTEHAQLLALEGNQNILLQDVNATDTESVQLLPLIGNQGDPRQVANETETEFSQRVLDPAYTTWWTRVADEIMKTKREWTYPLIFQLSVASISQVFSILDFFTAPADENTLSIGLALNSLWIWIIPVTFGWVKVGTQTSAGSIKKAMKPSTTLDVLDTANVRDESLIFIVRTASARPYDGDVEERDVENGIIYASTLHKITKPRLFFLGLSVGGDDAKAGPIFNYARVSSHRTVVAWTVEALEGLTGEKNRVKQMARLTAKEMLIYTTREDRERLRVHSHPREDAKVDHVLAAMIALILGWGTTGAGLLIAYRTPPVGLSCDSFAYLFYGSVATLAWVLLVVAAHLSHLHNVSLESSSRSHWQCLAPAAVCMRITGKALAFLNTGWLLVTSVAQVTNAYNNCMCSAAVIGLGWKKGWVPLLATAEEIAAAAKAPWISAISMLLFVVLMTWILVYILGKDDDVFKKQKE